MLKIKCMLSCNLSGQGNDQAVFVPPKGGGAVAVLTELRKILQALASLVRAINASKTKQPPSFDTVAVTFSQIPEQRPFRCYPVCCNFNMTRISCQGAHFLN